MRHPLKRMLKALRRRLPEGSWPRHLADIGAAQLQRAPTTWLIPRSLALLAQHYPEARFIQIGSNDGVKHDPLRRYTLTLRWQGLQVEPVPEIYAKLRNNTRHLRRITAVNAAIGPEDGNRPFYRLRAPDPGESVVDWYDGIGTFRREILLRHAARIPDLESRIECIPVPCLRFDTLCTRFGLEQLDLIHIDAEGYDFEILKLIDFARYRPCVVLYEHHHLGVETEASREYMEARGFETYSEGLDTLCVDTRSADPHGRRFLAEWRDLKAAIQKRAVA